MSEKITDRQNRRGWEQYRRKLEKRPLHRDFDGAIDGHVANVIAAYLEGRLRDSERDVFEQEMANSPDLLNTVIAARWGRGDTPRDCEVAPPAELVAWAKTLHANPPVAGAVAVHRRRAAWFFRPGVVVVAATLLLALVGAASVYVIRDDSSHVASLERKVGPSPVKPIGGKVERSGNSIFTDPKKIFFDGLDVE
jgi:hypothetical protein